MPDGSKMDPLLAKDESISDSGRASRIAYLRRKKKVCDGHLQLERGVRICERNNSADTKVSEEGGGGGAPGARAEKTMVRQAVPLQPIDVHSGADVHLQSMKDPTPEQVDAQSRL